MKRRIYYMIVRIHENTDRPGSADGKVVAKVTRRCRLGIFSVNDWREMAREIIAELGYTMGDLFSRHDVQEWTYISFIYGSFSKEGLGRSGSQLWRMPTKKA
jgi:hypothetical protein